MNSPSSNRFDEAIQVVKDEDETPVFVHECRIMKKSIFNKKRLIILSERYLFYFSKRMSIHRYNLFKINAISIDKKRIMISFAKDAEIKIALSKSWGELKENFIDSLFFVLQHLLTNQRIERIQFNIETDNISNSSSRLKLINLKPTSIPSYYGAFCHFELSLRDEFFNFDTQSKDILDQIRFRFSILFHRKLIELSSYRNQEYASKLLFETLPLLPSAKFLSIKQFNSTNAYMLLNNYLEDITAMQNISIDGDVNYQNDTVSFTDLFNKLKSDLNSKMVGLSFFNSNFTENHLTLIIQCVASKKIQALEFHNAFSNKAVTNFFITTFSASLSQCPDFASLYIEETEGVNFDTLSQNLPQQLKSLSVVNCEISVNQALSTIKTNSKFSNILKVLNLSLNAFDSYQESFIKDLKFDIPNFLTVIILDYVTFPYGILVPFLNSLFRSINNDTKISLVQMDASDDDFHKLDKMFKNLVLDFKNSMNDMRMIRSLKWDFNPISTHFIQFLRMQTKLFSLSVSGCFSPSDSKPFDDFCSYLSSNNSLSKLVCRRFNKVSLESLTWRLIKAVSLSKISHLDIANSHGGGICYSHLKSLLMNNFSKKNKSQNKENLNINLNADCESSVNLDLNSNEQLDTNAQTSESFHNYTNPNLLKMPALRCLIYDGLKPVKKEEMIDFIEFLSNDEITCKCSFPIHDIEYLVKQQRLSFDDITKIISCSQIKTPEDYIKPFTVFYKENQCHYPFYFKDENEDIQKQPPPSPTFKMSSNENENENNEALNDGNAFEVSEKDNENEMKTGNFFGIHHEKFNAINIDGKDPFIFSFNSEDNESEHIENSNQSQNQKRRSFFLMTKHPNTKENEMSYSKSYETDENDAFPLEIEEEEEDKEEEPLKSNPPQKNTSPVEPTKFESEPTQKVSSIQNTRPNKNTNKKNNDDDEYSYEYYSQDDKKPIVIKIASPIRNRPGPIVRPLFQKRPINPIMNNNIKKNPVIQLKLNDSSEYYYYSDDEGDANTKKKFSNDDNYYSNESDNSRKKQIKATNASSSNQQKKAAANARSSIQKPQNSNKPQTSSKSSINKSNTSNKNSNNSNQNQPSNKNSNQNKISKKNSNNSNQNQISINSNVNSNKNDLDDFDIDNFDAVESENGQSLDANNSNNGDGAGDDLPPLLTGDIDPAFNVMPNVLMSPNRKFEDLKQLKTDSYSSNYENDDDD